MYIVSRKNFLDFFKEKAFLLSIFLLASMYVIKLSRTPSHFLLYKLMMPFRITSYSLLAIKFIIDLFNKKYTKLETVLIIIFGLYMAFISYNSITFNYFTYYVLLVVGKNVDYYKIIKTAFISLSISTSLIIIMSFLNIIPSAIYIEGGRHRNSIGFTWAPYAQTYIFYLTLYYFIIRKNRISNVEIIVVILLNLFIFYMTKTRNALFCSFVTIVLIMLNNKTNLLRNNISIISNFLIIISLVAPIIIVVISYYYNSDNYLLDMINKIVNGRLLLGKEALKKGIVLWGRHLDFYNRNSINFSRTIDSSFVAYLTILGLPFYVLTIIYLMTFSFVIKMKKDIYMMIVLLVIIFHSMFDGQLFQLSYNYFMLLWAYKNTELITNQNNSILEDLSVFS